MVITGDVDPNEVVALAKTHLAPLPARAIATRREVPAAIASTTPTRVAAPVSAPAALVLFPMPARFHADRVAAEAAFERLVAFALVSSAMRGSASVVDRMVPAQIGGKQAELVGVAVTTESTAQLAAAVDEVFDGIDIGFDRNLDATELSHSYDIVRQRARLQVVANLATITTRATAIADYLDQGDDAGFFGAELAAIDALTPSQAQLVGRTYFDRARATVIEVVPELRGATEATAPTLLGQRPPLAEEFALPDDVDAAEAHTPLPVAELAPPEVESLELTLDDGLRVVLVHSTDVPVLQLQLIVGAGQLDTDGRPELAELVAHSFEGGGDTLAGERLGKFALAGGEYAPSVRARATSFSARGLSIYLDFLVAGLAEHVVHAEYQEGSMERWRRAQRKALRQGDAEQDALRHNRYFTALYGEGHPHVHARIATRSDLREVGKRDLEAFRHQHYRAGNSVLIVTGGFDLALAAAHIEAAFGARSRRPQHTRWLAPATPNTRPRAPEPRPGDVRVITEIDRGRTQTDVRPAFPLAEVYGEDHAALLVAAQMIDARVAAVREHLGASYGVYARIEFEQPRLEIGGALDSSRAAEALAAMLGAVHERPQGTHSTGCSRTPAARCCAISSPHRAIRRSSRRRSPRPPASAAATRTSGR
ncbi:MAG: insulinase family protein [Nannocystaceae bacterium]